jgi:hypothetical protein
VEIFRQLDKAGGDEVTCNIAGWKNNNHFEQYLTVEVSPEFVRYGPQPKPGMFDDIFADDE